MFIVHCLELLAQTVFLLILTVFTVKFVHNKQTFLSLLMLAMFKLEMKNKLEFLFLFLNVMDGRFSNKTRNCYDKTKIFKTWIYSLMNQF